MPEPLPCSNTDHWYPLDLSLLLHGCYTVYPIRLYLIILRLAHEEKFSSSGINCEVKNTDFLLFFDILSSGIVLNAGKSTLQLQNSNNFKYLFPSIFNLPPSNLFSRLTFQQIL